MEEAYKLMRVVLLLREREHKAPHVVKQLLGAYVVHVLLQDRDDLRHDPLDLTIQLLSIDPRILSMNETIYTFNHGSTKSINTSIENTY